MGNEIPEPMDGFESWLLRRVAQAVEAGKVSADLLTELQGEFEAAREQSPGEGEAAAVRQIAEIVGISEERAAKALSAIEAGTPVTRQRLLRAIAEAWLS